jgi:hypothetical protein
MDLLRRLDSFAASRPPVFVTHGEERSRESLGKMIEDRYEPRVDYPWPKETIEI